MINLIEVKARIKILTTEEGGKRRTGIKTGYRPNHVFERMEGAPFVTFMGDIIFSETEYIYPGDELIVKVRFIESDLLEKYINIGRKWKIYEVPNLIAEAEILEIL